MEAIRFLVRIWDFPAVRLLLACFAFGTSFTLGFRGEIGAGIAPLLDGFGLLGLISVFGASFWLLIRVYQLFITVSGSVVLSSFAGWRDIVKRWRAMRTVAFFPFWVRYKLRRHGYLYSALWWVLAGGLIYTAFATSSEIDASGRTAVLARLGWLLFQMAGFLVFGSIYIALQGIREVRDGRLYVPDHIVAALPKGTSSMQLRRGQRSFAGPVAFLFFLAIAGSLGQLYVSMVKYMPPNANIIAADGQETEGSILLTTPSGVLFFPWDTHLGTFRPLGSTDRIEALNYD